MSTAAPARGRPDSFDAARSEGMAGIGRAALLTLLVTGAVLLPVGLILRDHGSIVGGLSLLIVSPVLLWSVKRGYVTVAMNAAVAVVLAIGCYVVIRGEGIHDVGAGVFMAVCLLGALLLDRRGARWFALAAVVCVALIGTAEATGVLRTPMSAHVGMLEVLVSVIILSSTAWLTQALANVLYDSLRTAYESEQNYREIFDGTTEGIAIHDADTGAIMDANASLSRLSGFTREELTTRGVEITGGNKPEQDATMIQTLLRKAVEGSPQVFAWVLRRKDGTELDVEVALRAATLRGATRVIAAVRDVSERKLAAERMLATERLQAVGQLAGGVAHDFNNQLTAILANASLLRASARNDAATHERLDVIIQCSHRSADLTRQLLAFARKRQPVEQVVDLDDLITEITKLLHHGIDKRIEVQHRRAAGHGARVKGDPSLLQNALLNLGLNACDAMPSGGELTFTVDCVDARELSEQARELCDRGATTFVRVRVTDTGAGMAPEIAARVFEPFFTTKQHGNGMGLAATYGTVRAHGGAISLQSTVGAGTTFEVVLPATSEHATPVRASRAASERLGLRVLLADDEGAVARVMAASLEELGCTVVTCGDGQQAVDRFLAEPQAFDLAMLDYSMPRLSGRDAALRLREIRPDLPIIATSGFGVPWFEGDALARCIFLPKPFDFTTLRDALVELDAPLSTAKTRQ